MTFRLNDDDGIVLIASARALRERAFGAAAAPDLLAAMRARELVCAATQGAGEVEIVLDDSPTLTLGDNHERLGTYRLKLRPGDTLLAMPSCKLTAPGGAGGLPWAPGIYDVTVDRARDARRIVFGIQRAENEAANIVDHIPGDRAG